MADLTAPGPLGLFRREMDRLLHDYFGNGASPDPSQGAYPPLNLWEDDHAIHVEAEVPGIKIEQMDISVVGDLLTIRGERKSEEMNGMTCRRGERDTGPFARTIKLAAPIDASKVEASFKNGVLAITLPKLEQARPRRIEVKTAK